MSTSVSGSDLRQPPRFVPTLTEVVTEEALGHDLNLPISHDQPLGWGATEVVATNTPSNQSLTAIDGLDEVVDGAKAHVMPQLAEDQQLSDDSDLPTSKVDPSTLIASESVTVSWTQSFASKDGSDTQNIDKVQLIASLEEVVKAKLNVALQEVVQTHAQALYFSLQKDMTRLVQSCIHEAVEEILQRSR